MNNVIIRGFKSAAKLIGRGYSQIFVGVFVEFCRVQSFGRNNVVGSAVKIKAELSEMDNTFVFLESIKDQNGNTVVSEQAMTLENGTTDIVSVVWQSEESNIAGRYTYILRAVNGINRSLYKGLFFLEDK